MIKSGQSAAGQRTHKALETIMKILKTKTVAVMINQHSKKEMEEIEKEMNASKGPFYTLQQTIEMSRNENLHKDRR